MRYFILSKQVCQCYAQQRRFKINRGFCFHSQLSTITKNLLGLPISSNWWWKLFNAVFIWFIHADTLHKSEVGKLEIRAKLAGQKTLKTEPKYSQNIACATLCTNQINTVVIPSIININFELEVPTAIYIINHCLRK